VRVRVPKVVFVVVMMVVLTDHPVVKAVRVSIDDGTVVRVRGLDLVVDLEGAELPSRVYCTVTRPLSLV
jgi:hypothetical protein